MLRYLGTGQRDYAANPIRPSRRPWWEFQAVLSGRIAWTTAAGISHQGYSGPQMWLFAPAELHGWTGDGSSAEVVVFHYPWLPDGLQQTMKDGEPLTLPLSQAAVSTLRELSQVAVEHLRRPRASSASRHLYALGSLCTLIWDGIGDRQLAAPREMDQQRVADALAWYRQHLYLAPTVEEVAEAVFCSPAHLRRLFHEHCQCAPAQALLTQRLHRAQELLSAGELSMGGVAQESGFRHQAVFNRVFKAHYGVPPSQWRARQIHRNG